MRSVYNASAGASASGSGVSGAKVGGGVSSRRCERHGLGQNMAIRSVGQPMIKSPSHSSSSSDDSDSDDSNMQ